MAGANKIPSLPSNYVTVAQLQERWLRERDRKKKKEEEKEVEDEPNRPEDQTGAEAHRRSDGDSGSPEVGPVAGEEEADRKKKEEDPEPEPKPSEDQTTADVQRLSDRDSGSPELGAVAGEEVTKEKKSTKNKKLTAKKKKKNKKKPKSLGEGDYRVSSPIPRYGNRGIVRDEIRAQRDGLGRNDEFEPKFWSFSVNGWKEAGPARRNIENGSEGNELVHNVDVEPKVGVLSVNGWVRKGDGGVRRDDEEREEESPGFEARADIKPELRMSRETSQVGSESKPESSGLDRTVDREPKVGVNGGDGVGDGGLRRRDKKGVGGSMTNGNGKKDSGRAKRSRERGRVISESKPESKKLDCPGESEPKVGVFSVNGGVRIDNGGLMGNCEKDVSLETGVETMVEGYGEDQRADIKPGSKALIVNEGSKKNGRKKDWQMKRDLGSRQTRSESKQESHELNQIVVMEPKVGVFSTNGGVSIGSGGSSRNGEKEVSRGAKAEMMVERNGEDQRAELRALSVNDGLRKNNQKRDGWVRKNQESGQTDSESKSESNKLNQTIVSESKVGALSVNVGVRLHDGGSRRTSVKEVNQGGIGVGALVLESNGEDQRADITPELRVLSVNEGSKKNDEKRDGWVRRNLERGQSRDEARPDSNQLERTADGEQKARVLSVNGGFRRNGKKEVSREARGETMVESHGEERRANIGSELKALSVNEGSKKNDEKRDRWVRKNLERGQTRDEAGPESNQLERTADGEQKARVLSVNGGFSRNGKKEVNREARVKTMVESHGEERRANTVPELKILSMNEGSKKNDEKRDEWVRRNLERGQTRDETRPERNQLEPTADGEQKAGVLSVNGGFRRNGKKEVSREARVKTMVESQGEVRRANIVQELKALSVNEGSKKNDEKRDLWVRKNPETGQTSGRARPETNELEQMADSKPEVGVSSMKGEKEELHGATGKRFGGSRRIRSRHTHGYRKSSSNFPGRFSRRVASDEKDCGMVWVKKEELNGGVV